MTGNIVRTSLGVFAALAVAATTSAAQGALSTQGFGFPPGQLSTRALATGGGISEFDADTPINPATVGLSGEPRLFFQYEPEFRKLTNGGATSNTMTARFPVVSAVIPLGSRASVGFSASTLLDRSSATSITRDIDVAGTLSTVTELTQSIGAINDLRLAAGYAPSQKFQLGLGIHAYTGQNRVFFTQSFPDSLKFSTITQVTTLGFRGYAGSAGVLIRPSRNIGFALSGRKGFSIEARNADSAVSEADVPDRYGFGVAYEGIPGSSISAHVSRDMWSSLNTLSSAEATDTWEGGMGIESLGPRIMNRQTVLRIGGRYRTLPFLAAGSEVTELSFAAGLGAQFFRNRATFDFALERAGRKAKESDVGATERSYILSFGLRVRP
ncbi:MAG TPA: hypothetical protein VJL35_13710 [Gemmatimonadaceae bacterium]|nr:hypothetical protein [Gemmatimonadaceae bacterium]